MDCIGTARPFRPQIVLSTTHYQGLRKTSDPGYWNGWPLGPETRHTGHDMLKLTYQQKRKSAIQHLDDVVDFAICAKSNSASRPPRGANGYLGRSKLKADFGLRSQRDRSLNGCFDDNRPSSDIPPGCWLMTGFGDQWCRYVSGDTSLNHRLPSDVHLGRKIVAGGKAVGSGSLFQPRGRWNWPPVADQGLVQRPHPRPTSARSGLLPACSSRLPCSSITDASACTSASVTPVVLK